MISFWYSPKTPTKGDVEKLDEMIKQKLQQAAEQVLLASPYNKRHPKVTKTDEGYSISFSMKVNDSEEGVKEFDPVREFEEISTVNKQALLDSMSSNVVNRALSGVLDDVVRVRKESNG